MTATSLAFHNGTDIDNAGIANQGTRLMFEVLPSTLVAGTNILVPDAIWLNNGSTINGGISGIAMLVNTDSNGAGTYSPVYTGTSAATAVGTFSAISSTGIAVYEVIFADPFSIESASLSAIVTYTPQLNLNLPAPSPSTAQAYGGFAPTYVNSSSASAAHTVSSTLAIPRFVPSPSPSPANLFSVGKCACNLLFPYVTSAAGYDTGIAIANTSLDNLGISGGLVGWTPSSVASNSGTTAPAQQWRNCSSAAVHQHGHAGYLPANVSATNASTLVDRFRPVSADIRVQQRRRLDWELVPTA